MASKKKSPASILSDADTKHKRDLEAYVKQVEKLYKEAVKDISQLAVKVGSIPKTDQFSFSKNHGIETEVDNVISKLSSRIQAVIESGDREEWTAACRKSDAFLSSIMNTSTLPKDVLKSYQDRNLEALAAFQDRMINGMGLSDRVWNHVSVLKQEVETIVDTTKMYSQNGIDSQQSLEKIQSAIGTGMSADELSREIRSCLKEPNKLFRRVRDKYGNIHLSKNAQLYHPGQGVYRSSYKNAMRMTRSEINMAYRQSDYLRWQQLDFVVGLKVQLSGNHTCLGKDGKAHVFYDICDILAGEYPKDFKFTGWHPQCRCIATPIMKPYDEWNEDRKHLDSKAYRTLPASNEVKNAPAAFIAYIRDNEKRISGWKSVPYYIKDNPHYVDKAVNPSKYPATKLELGDDSRKLLEDYRMYAYNHQSSAKFALALDDALKAELSGDQKAFDAAMTSMSFIKKTNERVQEYTRKKKLLSKAAKKPIDPAQERHKYDAQIEELKKNAARYKLDMTKIDEAYTSLDLAKIEKAIKEQEALLEKGKERMGKIYAAADKRHAKEADKLEKMGLTRKEYAEKILAERRDRFEAIQKKTTDILPQAKEYAKDIDLTKLKDLQKRSQYNQMEKENAAIEAKLAEIKAADTQMADLIPDIAKFHKDYTLEEMRSAYDSIQEMMKKSGTMTIREKETFFQNIVDTTGNKLIKNGIGAKLAIVKVDIKIIDLTPGVFDIIGTAQNTNVSLFRDIANKAQSALKSRDVVQVEALLNQAKAMKPVVEQYDALIATGYKTSPKFNKAMDDCLQALNAGDVAQANKYVMDAAKIKADNDANVARRKAREEAARKAAEEAAKKRAEEEAAAAKKKTLPEAANIDDIREILESKTPVLLQHYEDSVARHQYTKQEYLDDEQAFHDKMKAMFDASNFSHCFNPNLLDGYLDKGILTNLQTPKGDYSGRRAWGHFGYGFQNNKHSSVPQDKWLKDGDYYRCGVPVSKDPTVAWGQRSGYGGRDACQIVLRKEKLVTTFTFDNSLGEDAIPSLTCDPKVCSLDRHNMRRFKDAKYNVLNVADGSYNDYIEIQYLPMGDTQFIGPEYFQSITLPEHPVGFMGKSKEFWEKWAEKGVDVMYYNGKTGKVETYLKGKGAIPAKYNETAAERKARLAKAKARAHERHEKRDKKLQKEGLTAETKAQALLAQRADEIARFMNESQSVIANRSNLINADFGKDQFKTLEKLVKSGNARAAKAEVERIEKALADQKAELEKLKDLIPDYERWHKDFTIKDLQEAHAAIQKQITWMENSYQNRNDPNEVIGKWGRIAKNVENPYNGAPRHKTWEVSKTAYLRKRDELIYKYRKDSIDADIAALKAFKTKDKDFMNAFKEVSDFAKEGKWGDVEEWIEKAKQRMLELAPPPGGKLFKLGESAQLLFKSEDFAQARKDAAKWFKCGDKATSAQIKKAFKAADDYMSQYAEEMWKNLTQEEKQILWLYTDGSQYINQEMLGTYALHMKSWIDGSMRNGLADANVLTSILEKAPALKDDMWMQSGKSEAAFNAIFGTNIRYADLSSLVGREGTSELFMSCHAARDGAFTKGASTGDSNNVVLSIFMPKGTKGAYMEPFASWGDSKRGDEGYKWDGKKRKDAPSDQVEYLLQRGAKFKITKAEYDPVRRKWYVDVDLIEQTAVGALNTNIRGLEDRRVRYKAPAS